jgi:hypothetical protein
MVSYLAVHQIVHQLPTRGALENGGPKTESRTPIRGIAAKRARDSRDPSVHHPCFSMCAISARYPHPAQQWAHGSRRTHSRLFGSGTNFSDYPTNQDLVRKTPDKLAR